MRRIWLSSTLAIALAACVTYPQPLTGIDDQVEVLSKAGSMSQQTVVKERMKSLMSEARKDILQAELKQAAAHIYASIGADPYGTDINGNEDVAIIAASLQAHWEARKPRPMMTLKYQLKLPPAFFGTNMITKLKE